MNAVNKKNIPKENNTQEPMRLLIAEVERAHREELQRIQVQFFEKVRLAESGRLQAEKEYEALEDKFLELEERYQNELAKLNAEISQAKEEVLDANKSLSSIEKKQLLTEGLRDNLDQERRGLLERLRSEEKRGAEERKKLEEENKAQLERINQLNELVSAATENRQSLEIMRAELVERVAALEGLRDNLDQERRGLLERLRSEEKRGAEERKKLEEENKAQLERINQLNELVSAATENRQSLEIMRAELVERVAALEGLRDNLDQERRGLLERLRSEEKRGAEERKKLEEENKAQLERINQLNELVSAATENRQSLEIMRAELVERVAALEGLRDNLDQERRGLLERLRSEEKRGAEERKKLEEENKAQLERINQLNELVSAATENRQSLEIMRAELVERVAALEGLRDNLDQERRGLLERLRSEEKRGAEERKKLEEENKAQLERINQLNELVSAATENRQSLEIMRAELVERVAALEGLRDNLDQERRGLLERLRSEEKRGAEERKKLEEERDFYRQAMISAEQQLDIVSKSFFHQVGIQLSLGWKGIIGLPVTIWSALRSVIFKENIPDAWLSQIEETYSAHGIRATEDFVRRKSRETVVLATGLTRLARVISPDNLDAALSFAKEATQIDPRPFRRKWLAFMQFDAGHVDIAYELLISLPKNVEFSPSEHRKAEYIQTSYHQLHSDSKSKKQPPFDPQPNIASRTSIDLSPVIFKSSNGTLTEEEIKLLDAKLKLALDHGKDIFRGFVMAQCNDHAKKFRGFCHFRAAQVALDAGEELEAMHLAEAALEEGNTVTNLRRAAKIFYNAARLDRAEELVGELENTLSEIKPNDRKFIDEVRARAQIAHFAKLPAQMRSLPIQPKKVLNILAFSLPYTSVGYSTRSHGLAIGIKNAGWDIRPYTRPGFPLDFKTELEGQTLLESDEIDGIVYRRIFDINRKGMSEVEYMYAAIAHYERIIRDEQPAVVHAASNYVTALPAMIAARRLGVSFIYEIRGFWEFTRSSRDEQFKHTAKYRFMKLFEDLTARHADRVITITTAMKEELMARGVQKGRICIVYNSVDPERFLPRPRSQTLAAELGIPESVQVIGYVGSFVDYEGLDDLIIACGGLKADGHDFRLLLVGDGAVAHDLMQQVEELDLTGKVIITGRVPHEMVEDYYSLIDIAAFPRKPWAVCELVSPLKPYEAMALEKAVVVSNTRALTEIVSHESNGLVFKKGNVVDLQTKLAKLLEDETLKFSLGTAAREWIKQERSWDLRGAESVSVYESVIRRDGV